MKTSLGCRRSQQSKECGAWAAEQNGYLYKRKKKRTPKSSAPATPTSPKTGYLDFCFRFLFICCARLFLYFWISACHLRGGFDYLSGVVASPFVFRGSIEKLCKGERDGCPFVVPACRQRTFDLRRVTSLSDVSGLSLLSARRGN